ncbi:MAG TPA: outer membrane beta-barrel protein [Vicinamibacterales bacterium]|nr:outer membrane beta-barrel protein [Vicinamibacterales bacterium]
MTRLINGALLVALLAMPAAATAQAPMPAASSNDAPGGHVAPLIGVTFGSDTTTANGTTVGIAGGWRSRSWWGVEGELAATPYFFQQTGFLTDRSVTTVMGNAIVSFGSRRASVFGIGGFGVIRINLAEAGDLAVVKTSEPGFNVGGGVMQLWTNNVGLRGDIRYFRAIGNTDKDVNLFGLEVSKLSFWRASAALVVGF